MKRKILAGVMFVMVLVSLTSCSFNKKADVSTQKKEVKEEPTETPSNYKPMLVSIINEIADNTMEPDSLFFCLDESEEIPNLYVRSDESIDLYSFNGKEYVCTEQSSIEDIELDSYYKRDDVIAYIEDGTALPEATMEPTAEPTYTIDEEDLCDKMESLAEDIFQARCGYRIATTNVDNVSRQISGFTSHFVSDYDVQDLKGCPQLGSFVYSRNADQFSVTASVVKSNFDSDGFTYYEGTDAELNATFNLEFHIWNEHDSSCDDTYDIDMSAIFVLEDGSWKIRLFNVTSLDLDFEHIDDED